MRGSASSGWRLLCCFRAGADGQARMMLTVCCSLQCIKPSESVAEYTDPLPACHAATSSLQQGTARSLVTRHAQLMDHCCCAMSLRSLCQLSTRCHSDGLSCCSHLTSTLSPAQQSQAQRSPAQQSPAQQSPTQQSRAQHSRAQHSKAQHSKNPSQPLTAQHSKAQHVPAAA